MVWSIPCRFSGERWLVYPEKRIYSCQDKRGSFPTPRILNLCHYVAPKVWGTFLLGYTFLLSLSILTPSLGDTQTILLQFAIFCQDGGWSVQIYTTLDRYCSNPSSKDSKHFRTHYPLLLGYLQSRRSREQVLHTVVCLGKSGFHAKDFVRWENIASHAQSRGNDERAV